MSINFEYDLRSQLVTHLNRFIYYVKFKKNIFMTRGARGSVVTTYCNVQFLAMAIQA